MKGICMRCGQAVEVQDGKTIYHDYYWPGSTPFVLSCPGSKNPPRQDREMK